MRDAELYEKNNSMQKREAIKCLDEYAKKMKWKQYGDRVIDIGCGDGGVTNILKSNYMPNFYGRVVGCDVSEDMIEFANEHHGDRRTEFQVLDIEGKVPEAFRESFDHVVSFNALHWIQNQETAFKNIHKLLSDNGDCLLLFLGHMPIYDVYRVLSRNSKWTEWLNDVDNYVSPYHDSLEPEKDIISMLKKIGFENIEVTCKQSEFIFDDEKKWKEAVAAVNPFDIPKELFDDFIEDYREVMSSMSIMDRKNNNVGDEFSITVQYSTIIVYARKKVNLNF